MQHGTHPHGLSEDEARHRLAAHGPNAIEDRERRALDEQRRADWDARWSVRLDD